MRLKRKDKRVGDFKIYQVNDEQGYINGLFMCGGLYVMISSE